MSAGRRRAQRVPALALRAAILPGRGGGPTRLAVVRPVEAAAQAQRPPVLVEGIAHIAAALEDGAEEGVHEDVVFIGHRNERANRRRYPHHRPCSTSIIGFQTGELVLERHGSLDPELIARVAAKHGLGLQIAAHRRLPVRRYRKPVRFRPSVSVVRHAAAR